MLESQNNESTSSLVTCQEWHVTPDRTPNIYSICSRCDQRRTFKSSKKFRVNANKRRLDVWLIYKCTHCDDTLNVEILARKPVSSINPDSLHAFTNNNQEMAEKIANNLRQIGLLGYELEDVPYTIEIKNRNSIDSDESITIFPSNPIYLRLDRLLSEGLGISRSQIDKMFSQNKIQTDNEINSLKKKRLFDKPVTLKIIK